MCKITFNIIIKCKLKTFKKKKKNTIIFWCLTMILKMFFLIIFFVDGVAPTWVGAGESGGVYGVCHNIDVRQEKSLKKLAVDENCFTPQKNLNHFNN
jgi:hypothetical protein